MFDCVLGPPIQLYVYGAKPPLGVATKIWELPAQIAALVGVTAQVNGARIVTDPSIVLVVRLLRPPSTTSGLLSVKGELPVGPRERKLTFATETNPVGVVEQVGHSPWMITVPRVFVPQVGVTEYSLVSPPEAPVQRRRFVSYPTLILYEPNTLGPTAIVNGTVNDAPMVTFVEPICNVASVTASARGENAPTANKPTATSKAGVRTANRQ